MLFASVCMTLLYGLLPAGNSNPDCSPIPHKIFIKEYPRLAAMASESGDVICRLSINKSGKIETITYMGGNKRLYLFTEDMLKKWEFRKSDKKNEIEMTVKYVIRNDQLPDSEFIFPNLLIINGAPRTHDSTSIVDPKSE